MPKASTASAKSSPKPGSSEKQAKSKKNMRKMSNELGGSMSTKKKKKPTKKLSTDLVKSLLVGDVLDALDKEARKKKPSNSPSGSRRNKKTKKSQKHSGSGSAVVMPEQKIPSKEGLTSEKKRKTKKEGVCVEVIPPRLKLSMLPTQFENMAGASPAVVRESPHPLHWKDGAAIGEDPKQQGPSSKENLNLSAGKQEASKEAIVGDILDKKAEEKTCKDTALINSGQSKANDSSKVPNKSRAA